MKSDYPQEHPERFAIVSLRPAGCGSIIGSFGAGVILMYFMDPSGGAGVARWRATNWFTWRGGFDRRSASRRPTSRTAAAGCGR